MGEANDCVPPNLLAQDAGDGCHDLLVSLLDSVEVQSVQVQHHIHFFVFQEQSNVLEGLQGTRTMLQSSRPCTYLKHSTAPPLERGHVTAICADVATHIGPLHKRSIIQVGHSHRKLGGKVSQLPAAT